MGKTVKYGINGALLGGAGNGVMDLIRQLNRMETNPQLSFDWWAFLKSIGKGALTGGGIGLGIGAIVDYRNSVKKPLDTDAFFAAFVKTSRLNKDDLIYRHLSRKADEIVQLFKTKYTWYLANDPMKGGSSEKGTALKGSFDIDVFVAFKPKYIYN